MAIQTAALAASYIFATGQEVLPLGGFTGAVPEPSPASLAAMVAAGRFRLALVATPSASASTSWIAGHCMLVSAPARASRTAPVPISVYFCG
jgi:hypothetical protein